MKFNSIVINWQKHIDLLFANNVNEAKQYIYRKLIFCFISLYFQVCGDYDENTYLLEDSFHKQLNHIKFAVTR